MNVLGPMLVLASFLPCTDALKKDVDKTDTPEFQGTWRQVYLEIESSDQPDQPDILQGTGGRVLAGGPTLKTRAWIAADKITVKQETGHKEEKEETRHVASFKVDSTKKPKAIDVVPTEDYDWPDCLWKGRTLRGIYILEGDILMICMQVDAKKPRPAKFSSKRDSGTFLVILRREKR